MSHVVLWYLQTFMIYSYLMTLPESESAECQIGTLGENFVLAKNKMAAKCYLENKIMTITFLINQLET